MFIIRIRIISDFFRRCSKKKKDNDDFENDLSNDYKSWSKNHDSKP